MITLKKSMPPAIVLFAFALCALARVFHVWTEAEMQKASELIAIGTVASVRDLNETNAVLWPGCKFVGVETTFKVSRVLKGNATNSTIALHHYRFDPSNFRAPNGPCFIDLKATDTNRFLLYLVSDGTGRFAHVSGQLDPACDAVKVFPQE